MMTSWNLYIETASGPVLVQLKLCRWCFIGLCHVLTWPLGTEGRMAAKVPAPHPTKSRGHPLNIAIRLSSTVFQVSEKQFATQQLLDQHRYLTNTLHTLFTNRFHHRMFHEKLLLQVQSAFKAVCKSQVTSRCQPMKRTDLKSR
jgi:hypothetical protein